MMIMVRYSLKSKKPFTIRKAKESDAKAIGEIVDSVASEKYYVVPESSREDWNEAIREIKNRKGIITVAQVNGKIVGMAHIVRGKFEKNRHVGFLGITILKDFRRIGIGTAMMVRLIEWAKKQEDLEKISLTVFSTNKAAINLYGKLGFKMEGKSKKQYKIDGKYVDEITMGKFLT
jgi:RimJ/RimL family protein N-acetyltransferase